MRVSTARHSPATFAGRSIWCRELFGPVAPDTFRRWHDGGACDVGGRPPVDLPPFALSRLANLTHVVRPGSVSASPFGSTSTVVCCASSKSNSSPPEIGRGSFHAACSYHGSSRRLTPATGRVRLTLPQSANSCSCASSTCAIASESGRIAYGTWKRQLCAWFQQSSVGGPRGWNQIMSSPRAPLGHACCKHERRHVDWTTLPAPARVTLSDALDHARRSLGHDRRD